MCATSLFLNAIRFVRRWVLVFVSAEPQRIFFGATFYAIFSAHAAHDNDMAESVSSPRSNGRGPPRASRRIDGVDGVRRYVNMPIAQQRMGRLNALPRLKMPCPLGRVIEA
jgi:hypothetical protein